MVARDVPYGKAKKYTSNRNMYSPNTYKIIDSKRVRVHEAWRKSGVQMEPTLGNSRMETRVRRHTTVNISQSHVTTRIWESIKQHCE